MANSHGDNAFAAYRWGFLAVGGVALALLGTWIWSQRWRWRYW